MKAKDNTTYAVIRNEKVTFLFTKAAMAEWNENDIHAIEVPKNLLNKVQIGTEYKDGQFVIIKMVKTKPNKIHAMLDNENRLSYVFRDTDKPEYKSDDNVVIVQDEQAPEIQVGDLYNAQTKQFETSLEYVRFLYKDECDKLFEGIFDSVCGERVPTTEMISWQLQEAEARAYMVHKESAQVPYIAVMAQTQGRDLEEFATKIIEKADKYRQASSFIIGYRQKVLKDLESAEDIVSLRKARFNVEFVLNGLGINPQQQ